MKIIDDFECPECGAIEEHFVPRGTLTVRCSECGCPKATKVLAPIRSVMDPVSGHFHDATRKWIKHHEKHGGSTGDA